MTHLRRPRLRARFVSAAAGSAVAALLLTACAASSAGGDVDGTDRAEALATFDEVWSTVQDTHFDPDMNGVDWDAVRDELRPRAAEARDDDELRGVINEMLGRLEQSHFGMMPRTALPALGGDVGGDGNREAGDDEAGGFGFQVRIRDGQALVSKVNAGGPADVAGVRPGWVLRSLHGDDLTERIESALAGVEDPKDVLFGLAMGINQALVGPIDSKAELGFLDAGDAKVTRELTRAERDVVVHEFGTNLPTFFLHFDKGVIERDGKRIGRIHFTNWFLPMQGEIDTAVDEMRDCDAIVIDLRGNTGGAGAMVMGTAGHFYSERTELGVTYMREGKMVCNALPRKLNPAGKRVEPFAGPLAILTDEMTGSASEMFAGGVQSTGRARVFGETTAGAVLPAMTRTLPNGDGLLYAMGDFTTADGTQLEGRGVIPDVDVPLTREALLSQSDPVLEAALEWIVAGAGR